MSALITAAVITAVAAGVGAYSSYQSGKAQQMQADWNARSQELNARMQLTSMQAAANLQKRQAEANFMLRGLEAKAHENNAISIENQAIGQDRINRVNARKRADEFASFQGKQRAAIAASGIVESVGTPLDVLAETAEKIQRDQEETHYGHELQRRSLFREAALERLGGKMALAGATLDRNAGLAAASLSATGARMEHGATMRGAELTRIGGAYARQAANGQAAATLLSGLGQSASYARS